MKKKLCLLLVAALLTMLLVVPACAEELDCSAMDTARTSPDSPTSPHTMVFASTGLSFKLDTSAMIMARSRAGSFIFMPPAIFT